MKIHKQKRAKYYDNNAMPEMFCPAEARKNYDMSEFMAPTGEDMSRNRIEELKIEIEKMQKPFLERVEEMDRNGEEFLKLKEQLKMLQNIRNKLFFKAWSRYKYNSESREGIL